MSTINITPIAAVVGSVTVSRGRKVNLGNYEAEDVFVSVTLPVHTGEDYQSVCDQATTFVQENIEAEVASLGSKTINKVAAKRIAKETTVETKVEEKSEPVKTEKVKQSDVRQALKDVKDKIGNDEYKLVLAEFDAKAFTALDESNYAAVLQSCQKLLAEAEEAVDEAAAKEVAATEDDDLDDENTEVITLDEFKAACKQYNADNGAGSHKAVLSSAGYTTVNEVPATEYASLMAEMI